MLLRRFLPGIVLVAVGAGPLLAQTTPTKGQSQSQEVAKATTPGKDPTDLKLQEALRERDAIIRNLLERMNELEWRVNGGYTSAAQSG